MQTWLLPADGQPRVPSAGTGAAPRAENDPGIGREGEPAASPPVLDFAGFRLDPARGLFRAGQRVPLARKELRGLSLLLARHGAVVSRDEYVQAVWPRGDASDDSIARSIYLLRRALSSDAGAALVETVYGVGYRVAVPVTVARTGAPSVRARMAAVAAPAAFETLLVGRQWLAQETRAAIEAAVRACERAAQIDPGYAPAWSAVAQCHVFTAMRAHLPPREAGRHALLACERALAIDPDEPGALAARGWVLGAIEGRFEPAMADIALAIELDPGFWFARLCSAWLLPARGRLPEALDQARTAAALNPLHPAPRALLGWLLFCAGRTAEALGELRGALAELHQPQAVLRTLSLVNAWEGGNDGEALELAQRIACADDCTRTDGAILAYVLARRGDAAGARRIVQGWPADAEQAPLATHAAAAHLALGDPAAAARAWSRAEAQGCPYRVFATSDPRLAPLATREPASEVGRSSAHRAHTEPPVPATAPAGRVAAGALAPVSWVGGGHPARFRAPVAGSPRVRGSPKSVTK